MPSSATSNNPTNTESESRSTPKYTISQPNALAGWIKNHTAQSNRLAHRHGKDAEEQLAGVIAEFWDEKWALREEHHGISSGLREKILDSLAKLPTETQDLLVEQEKRNREFASALDTFNTSSDDEAKQSARDTMNELASKRDHGVAVDENGHRYSGWFKPARHEWDYDASLDRMGHIKTKLLKQVEEQTDAFNQAKIRIKSTKADTMEGLGDATASVKTTTAAGLAE